MITKTSYFVGDIFIPQVGHGASTVANDNKKLTDAITKYEVELLVKGLGRKLCKEFYTNIDSSGSVKSGADSKWSNLLIGEDYTENGEDFFWRGLVDTTGNFSECLMAYYIYYHFVREGLSLMTTMGAKKGQSQNTTDASATTKMVDAWRTLYKWYYGEEKSNPNIYMYKGHYVEDYYSGDNSNDVSLYKYLTHRSDLFQDWRFTQIGNKNSFGI